MDIHVSGPTHRDAVGAIFGEDISPGPLRKAPPVLAQFLHDWPGHRDDFVEVALEPPPRSKLGGFKLRFHRVQIIGGGRFMGYALRMDSLSFQSLEAYELCWARHRDLHAH